ncbi:hypothetical protein [Deinococcus petrolearius]|uniref:Uncharacterized protein n=1 Tax=Deinococcus petrolearius TaxID=1751295 RepID=A0ABW1DP34_9DEIO
MWPLDDPRWQAFAHLDGIQERLYDVVRSPDLILKHTGRPTHWDSLLSDMFHLREASPAMMHAFPLLVHVVALLRPEDRGEHLIDLADAAAQFTLGTHHPRLLQLPTCVHDDYQVSLRVLLPITQEAIAAGAHRDTEWDSEEALAALLSLQAFARDEQRLGVLLARWHPYTAASSSGPAQPVWALQQYEELTGGPDVDIRRDL